MNEQGNTYSMTGFGRAEGEVSGARLTVEARSVNHRYLDARFRLPPDLAVFEPKLNDLVKDNFSRGRIEIYAEYEPGTAAARVTWNRPLAEGIMKALAEMGVQLKVKGEPDLALLSSFRDVIVTGSPSVEAEELWPEVERVFKDCFQSLRQARAREGAALEEDLISRIEALHGWAAEVSELSGEVTAAYRDRMSKRVTELLNGIEPDQDRLAQEAALFADRSDITEELVRLGTHLDAFRHALSQEGPKGRKLDFLAQEIFRETNTFSNKAQHARVSALAVEMKAELEKIREQVQNIE